MNETIKELPNGDFERKPRQNPDIRNLENKIEWVKTASVFEKQAAAESALHTLVNIIKDQEQRISQLEIDGWKNA